MKESIDNQMRDGSELDRPTDRVAVADGARQERQPAFNWEPLLTPVEAAVLLRIHPKTALRLVRAHHLPGVRLGKHWRFRQCDLTAWVEGRLQSDCQPSDCQEE
jgi:excisionase family DNA binding protein